MAEAARVLWAPRARQDLLEIWGYFARVGSVEVADRLMREFAQAGQRLSSHPLMGRARNELAPGLRSVLVHPYVVFYRMSDGTVEIARVLHQHRDLNATFSTERGR